MEEEDAETDAVMLESHLRRSPYNFSLGFHNALFMVAEIGLLTIQTLHALSICFLEHLKQKYQRRRGDVVAQRGKSEDQSLAQSISFYFDITTLLFDLVSEA